MHKHSSCGPGGNPGGMNVSGQEYMNYDYSGSGNCSGPPKAGGREPSVHHGEFYTR